MPAINAMSSPAAGAGMPCIVDTATNVVVVGVVFSAVDVVLAIVLALAVVVVVLEFTVVLIVVVCIVKALSVAVGVDVVPFILIDDTGVG